MSAQPKYITQPEFDAALTAFSGHVDHTINMAKAEQRRDLIGSEDRLSVKIDAVKTELQAQIQATKAELQTQIQASESRLQAQIQATKAELQTQINELKQQVDRVENIGKSNHQMFQIMLDQMSKINKKLGVD